VVTEARIATAGDLSGICRALRRSFWDDPFMGYLLPDGVAGREKRMEGLMRMEAEPTIPEGTVFTSTDGDAAAIWKAPGKWKMGGTEMVKQLPLAMSVLRGGLVRGLGALTMMEKKHPTEPHWYLAVLGTVPEAQGKGKGTSVMQPILDRCDDEGLPAYLESSKERNVPFYERHGFKVTEVIELPKGGPQGWLMWRDPR
jgi:ribosomal protein S18 acetylase RimI-like enzyme